MKKYKVVEVTWIDIETHGGWNTSDRPFTEMRAYGILKMKNKEKVVLACTLDPDTGHWSDEYRFPRGCVKRIRVIEEVEI